MSAEGLPIPSHTAGEFYVWLWWASEGQSGTFDLPDPVGRVDVWVDERIAFRNPEEQKVVAVMTGENPSASLEARAALAGGKVLQDLRIGARRDDREFFVTLKGPNMHFQGLKLPQVVSEGGEEVLYERMHLYDELCLIVAGLFKEWSALRTTAEWDQSILPELRRWVTGKA